MDMPTEDYVDHLENLEPLELEPIGFRCGPFQALETIDRQHVRLVFSPTGQNMVIPRHFLFDMADFLAAVEDELPEAPEAPHESEDGGYAGALDAED